MALITIHSQTSDSAAARKLPVCHTCKQRKEGLFTVDSNGKPQCGDCADAVGKAIPGYVVPHG